MICSPCGQGRHNGCRWPASCPCHHRDPAAELVAETAANDRVDRARILAGGHPEAPALPSVLPHQFCPTGEGDAYEVCGFEECTEPSWSSWHVFGARILAPQTGPLVPRIIDHHVA